MPRSGYLFTLLFFIFSGFLSAQNFVISGFLANQEDQSPLAGATVKLVNPQDTLQYWYTSSGRSGEFRFEKLEKGRYRLEVTFIGFEKYMREVMAGSKGNGPGKIMIRPAATNLGAVDISGTAIRAEQKGDTTQYNAAAFKMSQDASTEDLVKKMPGITIENGTVKAHGEEVKKVLVDGKQFFGDDPGVTLKNLPAEVVDKIQVFDKLSDQAAWTGFDDGSGQKTLNIVTKNAKNEGQFGKFSAGYGSDDRYLLGANLNLFKEQRRITLLAMSNNVNQQNFSAEDILGSSSSSNRQPGMGGRSGGGSSFQMGPQSGIFTTHALGFNFTDTWGKKLTVNASYFWNYGINNTEKSVNRQYILGENVNQYYQETSNSKTDNANHRLNMRIEYSPDTMNSIILTPRISFQDNAANSSSGVETATDQDFILSSLLNSSQNENINDGNGYNFNNDILYRHKFKKKGRTYSVNLSTGITKRYRDNFVDTKSFYYLQEQAQSNDTISQYGKSVSNGLNLGSNLVYTEPIGKSSQLQFSYNLSWAQNDNDKKTYNYVNEESGYALFDTLLSNIYDNDYITHRAGTGYLYQTAKANLNAGISYQYAELKGNTSFPLSSDTRKPFHSVLPNLMFNYKFDKLTNLRVVYRASTNAPSTTQLQSVIDNSNPLLLTTGNPDLKQEFRHFIMSRYSRSNADKTLNLFGMLFFQKTMNYIGNSTLVAASDLDTLINQQLIHLKRGGQLSLNQNLDGAWNIRSLVTVGLPVKPIKCNVNFNAGVSYNRLPSLINGSMNESSTYGYNLGVVLSSNISEKLDFTFTYNLNYNLVDNSLQPELNNDYFYQIGSAQFNWEFWKGFFFQNSLTYQNYNGLSSSISNEYLLWNINVGKKLFKNKAGEIKLACYDILDQNKSVNRSVTDTYIEDSDTRVLRQYFMLSFTYNLRNFTGKVPGSDKERPVHGPGFEGRPYDGPHMH